jgi:heat shock protein beta
MFAKKQKLLEVNPRSPLMEGLLRRVQQLPNEDEGRDLEAEEELKEVVAILIDGALVRSGYDVTDSNEYVTNWVEAVTYLICFRLYRFYTRVERVLRRSLGVSETVQADMRVKPAPPVDPSFSSEEDEETGTKGPHFNIPSVLDDKVSITMEEIDDDAVHDEL